jgi:hypothetical protein
VIDVHARHGEREVVVLVGRRLWMGHRPRTQSEVAARGNRAVHDVQASREGKLLTVVARSLTRLHKRRQADRVDQLKARQIDYQTFDAHLCAVKL